SSPTSWEDAARRAVHRADETLAGLLGIHVLGKKAKVEGGRVVEYRIRLRLLFEVAPDFGDHV
ncbi:MAG: dodecin domain-containing protein, partial [Myxococcales bacterium]|nr:dodecin domain-containing protein [Myxococcales bacterium]